MRVTNFKTRFLKNGSSDHFGTNVPDLVSSSILLGYKSPSYDFSKKFKVLLGRCDKLVANVHSISISNCIFEPKSWLLQLATAREHWRAEIGEVVQDTISGYRGWQPQPLGAGQTEIKQTNPSAFDRTKCGIAIGKLFTYSHIFMQFYCFNFMFKHSHAQ